MGERLMRGMGIGITEGLECLSQYLNTHACKKEQAISINVEEYLQPLSLIIFIPVQKLIML